MTLPPTMHWLAALAFSRMLYCLVEGTALAVLVSVALRLAPQKNSRTRFAIWLATLAAVVLLPFIQAGMEIGRGSGVDAVLRPSGSAHPLLTFPTSWAEYMLLGWAALAVVGLLRVGVSLWQIRRLRRGCTAIDPRVLGPELEAMVEEFQQRRPASILVSPSLEVPTAIGFIRPAVLIPAWLANESQREELKYVLLHELSHLQRWDDWTNLAQKLVKAVLFFHPGVWWIEREMSLDREMACDDAVLAQATSPRVYAQCLARIAEKSFLRRQMALAQAAVDRVRQLTLRVTRILDGNRPRSTRLWKPAVPMVAAIALLCAVSTSSTPDLVSLRDNQPPVVASAGSQMESAQNLRGVGIDQVASREAAPGKNVVPLVKMAKFTAASAPARRPLRALPANLRSQAGHSSYVRPRYEAATHLASKNREDGPSANVQSPGRSEQATLLPTNFTPPENDREEIEGGAQQYGVVLLVVTSARINSSGSFAWQVNMWEVRVPAPSSRPTKPIPRKT
jgi:beta-lactamase regulating signal transducer with metallopeptidase domain